MNYEISPAHAAMQPRSSSPDFNEKTPARVTTTTRYQHDCRRFTVGEILRVFCSMGFNRETGFSELIPYFLVPQFFQLRNSEVFGLTPWLWKEAPMML